MLEVKCVMDTYSVLVPCVITALSAIGVAKLLFV